MNEPKKDVITFDEAFDAANQYAISAIGNFAELEDGHGSAIKVFPTVHKLWIRYLFPLFSEGDVAILTNLKNVQHDLESARQIADKNQSAARARTEAALDLLKHLREQLEQSDILEKCTPLQREIIKRELLLNPLSE